MIPYPFENYVPKLFKENLNSSGQALCDLMDRYMLEWKNEILALMNLNDIDTCPQAFLVELGYQLNAGIKSTDTDRTKRQKIYKAIETHKTLGSWKYHAKIVIDAITGYNAIIYTGVDSNNWIECGDGFIEVGSDWAIEGGDGVYTGILELGAGTESEIPGNIYINCHLGVFTPVLSAGVITQLVDALSYDIVPAYMRIFLGYIDVSGVFQIYATIA